MLRFSLLNQLEGLDQSGEGAFVLQVPLALPMEAGKVSAPLRPCWLWDFCPSPQPSVVYAGLALTALCWHWSELSSKQGWQCLAAEAGQEREGEGFQPPDPRIKELAAKLR